MKDVIIKKLNDTWMSVTCSEVYMEMEISDRFSFEVDNAKFDPRVRSGRWDGIKRLYNRRYKRMYCGLLLELLKFLNHQGYSYEIDPLLLKIGNMELEDLRNIVEEVIQPFDKGKKLKLYDYQEEAVLHQLNSSRSIVLAATSAGKSLILYTAVRIYQLLDEMEGKHIFIVVPSKSLVEQLYSDFKNYSNNELKNWNVDTHCQRVNGDYSKHINKQIVITTWHSLKDIPKYHIENAGAIFVDEVHTIKGPVLSSLLEKAIHCPIRHGVTGTLDGFECNELAAQGLMGPVQKIVSAKELIDSGRATKINVTVTIFDYDNDTKRAYHEDQCRVPRGRAGLAYQSEINFINNLKCRFDMIQNIAKGLKGNTIILFDRVETYGIPLYEDMKSRHPNTFLIVGDVKAMERESIRLQLEDEGDAIVYATSKIMSTGISIKNLHNIIYVSSTKSKVAILQSIGRLMRLHESKKVGNFIDIVDKLDYNGKPNYVLKHVEERMAQYVAEGHPVQFHTFKLVEKSDFTLEDALE